MESSAAAMNAARRRLHIAEHMLTQTYPLVKDPKLLLGVLQNTFGSVDAAVKGALLAEYEQKRIPPFSDTFQGRLTAFRQHVVPLRKVPKEHLVFVGELREIIKEHEEAPVEFSKGQKFVIADGDYHLTKLTPELMRKNVAKAKELIAVLGQAT